MESKRRLLHALPRTEGGFRAYSDDTVQQVTFIKQAQSLGLTLDDVQQLLTGRQRRAHVASCRKVRDLLTRRIEDIDVRITQLREFRRTLKEQLVGCEQALAATVDPACPTIDALDHAKRASEADEKHAEKVSGRKCHCRTRSKDNALQCGQEKPCRQRSEAMPSDPQSPASA